MTDTTTTEPRRARRPARSRRPINLRRRRRNHAQRPPLAAAEALTRLAVNGDVYKIGRQHYLVAPIDPDMLDTVIATLGAVENDEPETDLGADDHGEPSLLTTDGDLELDTSDYEPSLGYVPMGGAWHQPVEDAEGPDTDAEPSYGADAPEGDPCDHGEEDHADDEPSRVVPTGGWRL